MVKQRANFVRMAAAVITAAAVCVFITGCDLGTSENKPKEEMVEVTFEAGAVNPFDEEGAYWETEDGGRISKIQVQVPYGSNGYNYKPEDPKIDDESAHWMGWYFRKGSTPSYKYDFRIPIKSKLLLTGKWGTTEAHDVTFDANGGKWTDGATQKTIEKDFDQEIDPNKLDLDNLSRSRVETGSNLVFCGWYLDQECTKEFKYDAEVYEDITVFAYWADVKCTWEEFKAKVLDDKFSSEQDIDYTVCIADDAAESIDFINEVNSSEHYQKFTTSKYKFNLDFRQASKLNTIAGFSAINSLKYVSLPASLRTIKTGAFTDCLYLSEVNITEGCEEICSHAFSKCMDLRKLYLPESIKKLDQSILINSLNIIDMDVVIYSGTSSQFEKIDIEVSPGSNTGLWVSCLDGSIRTLLVVDGLL
ncbi:repeat domain-containing protein [Treponema sp. JC4]|uniref:leucine-rich repeat protein n=1 Tax=Treponema sp. JC4 TaxID=1124982 RepID=UPI00025B0BD3|nr:leucine-rich repeat protein [Treponema sp. JC4]EID85742.1 repeat domain-containing protein [Treponema sp. JC4]